MEKCNFYFISNNNRVTTQFICYETVFSVLKLASVLMFLLQFEHCLLSVGLILTIVIPNNNLIISLDII